MKPELIKTTRESLGISTTKAALLVHVSERNWRRWESGDKQMPAAAWELFQIKAKELKE